MSELTLKSMTVHTNGELPAIGTAAPKFELIKQDLSSITLSDLSGKKVLINVFPSLDTVVCAASVEEFNKHASTLDNTVVLCVSMDLPFAHKRFCESMSINGVITASDFRNRNFGRDYGLTMVDGPLGGLLARAVIVLNSEHKVTYTQLVSEVTDSSDYDAALAALKAAE